MADILLELEDWKRHFTQAGAPSFVFIIDTLIDHEKRLRKLESERSE